MTFTELTRAIAENNGITHTQAKAITKDVFATITQRIAQGDQVRITDFGTFQTAFTAERKLNDAMGGGVKPAHNRVKLKPATALKRAVN